MEILRGKLRHIGAFWICASLVLVAWNVAAAQEPAATEPEGVEGPHGLTVEDLWAMQRIGEPQVSPDGQWVVFTVTEFSYDDNKSQRDLWLAAADGSSEPRRLTWHPGNEGSPAWSPDGKHLIFTAKRDEDAPSQLHRLAMDGGEAEPLTDLPMGVQSPRWFPDGKRIAFAASTYPGMGDDFEAIEKRMQEAKDDKTQAKISENRLLRFWDAYRTDGTVPHVFVLDIESGDVRDIMPGVDGLIAFRGLSWDLSPDGRHVAFSGNITAPPWQQLDWALHLVDVESGEIRVLTGGDTAGEDSPRFSPDGEYIYFGHSARPTVAPDFTHLARYRLEDGTVEMLTEDWDHQPSGWTFSADGRQLFFHAQDRGFRKLYSMPAEGGTPKELVSRGSTSGVAPAGDDRLVYRSQSFHRPAELYVMPAAGGEAKPLTDFNGERLANIEFGTVEDVTFEGADGNPVQMFLLYPPGFDANQKWPLLMMVHGGPHGAWTDSFHYRWNAALFGSPGYVVAALNFHGSTGFGQAFAESILGNHADKPFADVMAATDYLLERGFIDENRMAAAGGSYGGYLVSWILGHTDRFAALVNHAGVYDLMGQFASDYTWSRDNNYGAAPWTNPNRIDLYSPSRYAANFKTPTLILHGEKDYRVPYTQGVNLHGVLTGKGVPSRIVIFPNENHWILRPQSAKLWWTEVHGWLDRYIGVGPSADE